MLDKLCLFILFSKFNEIKLNNGNCCVQHRAARVRLARSRRTCFVQSRLRTRTRTKELVCSSALFFSLSPYPFNTTWHAELDETCFNYFVFVFLLLFLFFSDVLLRANDGGTERAESTQTRQRQQQSGTGRQRAAKPPEIAELGQQLFVVVVLSRA